MLEMLKGIKKEKLSPYSERYTWRIRKQMAEILTTLKLVIDVYVNSRPIIFLLIIITVLYPPM